MIAIATCTSLFNNFFFIGCGGLYQPQRHDEQKKEGSITQELE